MAGHWNFGTFGIHKKLGGGGSANARLFSFLAFLAMAQSC